MVKYKSTYDPANAPKDLEHLIYEKKGHVAYVTINRPEVRNALHTFAYIELRRCWLDIARDPNIFCAIVTGAGDKAFCAGRDVKFLQKYQAEGKRTPHEDPNDPNYFWGGGGQPKDVKLEKPLIAALNGFAVGVGMSIALQGQIRIMAEHAWLGDQHTAIGRTGSPHRVIRALPMTAAAYITLCNGRLEAKRCYELGIVNEVVPLDQLIPTAERYAEMICNSSPRAVQACVRLFNLTNGFSPELEAYARHLDQEVAEGPDGIEGPLAFKEKRKPNWQIG